MTRSTTQLSAAAAAIVFSYFLPATALGHCDGMDGPVITAARKALETGKVNVILIWVQPKDEAEIRQAFDKATAVRKLGSEARDLADQYFFETLVRVHRAGEGAPYTGLKPAGRDLGPAIPAADEAIATGRIAPVAALLVQTLERGLHERFEQLTAAKTFAPGDLAAGRQYVKTYVTFIHYVEGLYQAAAQPLDAHEHAAATAGTAQHGHQD